jgi:glycosyltransferase involved in cell wall biosynthesis
VSEDWVVTIPNGVEPFERPTSARIRAIRAELAIPVDAPLIVTVARLAPEKGIVDLLEATPLIHQAVPGVHLVIAGEGELRNSLVELAGRLGVANRVHFTGFRADVSDLIGSSDVMVLPSPAEPFGLVLLEAMSVGCPVVAVAAGGPLEIVDDGRTGRLVPAFDPSALAKAISEVLTDPDRLAMGQEGRLRFLQYFTAERMASNVMTQLYRAGAASTESPEVKKAPLAV